jgi:hypothetical protein
MSGMNEALIMKVLGYDDNYVSSPAQRLDYEAIGGRIRAKPEYVVSLSHPRLPIRPPGNEAEALVAKIVESTLKRMRTPH